jgi:hypothetical protein
MFQGNLSVRRFGILARAKLLLYPYSFCFGHWGAHGGATSSFHEFPNHVIVRTNRRTSRLDACFSDRCLVLKHRTGISFTLSLGLSWIPCRWIRSPKGLACSSFTGCYPQISRNRHPDGEYMPHSNVYPNMPHQHCAWGQFLRLHTQFAVVKCSCYLSQFLPLFSV